MPILRTIKFADIIFQEYSAYFVKAGEKHRKSLDHPFEIELILLDIMKPEMDGHGVCHALKVDPKRQNIPGIFIFAKSAEAHIPEVDISAP